VQVNSFQGITNISPLASCAVLKHIGFSRLNKLEDISALSACKELILGLGCLQKPHGHISYKLVHPDSTPASFFLHQPEKYFISCKLHPAGACRSESLPRHHKPLLPCLVPPPEHLDLRHCRGITSISPLSACQELQEVILRSYSQIYDVSPLIGCTKLQKVGLADCLARAQAEQILGPDVAQWCN
jgi:hypothetical protein